MSNLYPEDEISTLLFSFVMTELLCYFNISSKVFFSVSMLVFASPKSVNVPSFKSLILVINPLNKLITPFIPTHLGLSSFVSPSIISLQNLRVEHSILDNQVKIELDLINPKRQMAKTKTYNTVVTIKNGNLQKAFLQQQQQQQLQQQLKAQQFLYLRLVHHLQQAAAATA